MSRAIIDREGASFQRQAFDRAPIGGHPSKQIDTSHGYLLCKDVPIARTGTMLYADGELGADVEAGPDGIITAHRRPEEVFSEATIASFEGAAITIDHVGDIMPTNWRGLAVGIVQNVRRGDPSQSQGEFLIADMLITDQAAIDLVKNGQREVSCGYTHDCAQLGPGQVEQINIRGNHVALVEKGRCGPLCAIGDKESKAHGRKDSRMTDKKAKKRSAWDRIMTAFKAQDEEAITEAIAEAKEEAEEEGTTQRVVVEVSPAGKVEAEHTGEASDKAMVARMDKLERTVDSLARTVTDSLAKFAKDADKDDYEDEKDMRSDDSDKDDDDEDEDKKKKSDDAEGDEDDDDKKDKDKAKDRKGKDSAFDAVDWRDTVAKAEILFPGMRLPTHDKAMSAKSASDTLCKLRRATLTRAYATDEGKAAIEQFLTKGRSAGFDKMTCDAARAVFDGASALMAFTNNNKKQTVDSFDPMHMPSAYDPAERNKRNRDFWAKHGS